MLKTASEGSKHVNALAVQETNKTGVEHNEACEVTVKIEPEDDPIDDVCVPKEEPYEQEDYSVNIGVNKNNHTKHVDPQIIVKTETKNPTKRRPIKKVPKIAKSAAQRSREYRERQRALKYSSEASSGIVQDSISIVDEQSTQHCRFYVKEECISEEEKFSTTEWSKKTRRKKDRIKSTAQRSREYRARKKMKNIIAQAVDHLSDGESCDVMQSDSMSSELGIGAYKAFGPSSVAVPCGAGQRLIGGKLRTFASIGINTDLTFYPMDAPVIKPSAERNRRYRARRKVSEMNSGKSPAERSRVHRVRETASKNDSTEVLYPLSVAAPCYGEEEPTESGPLATGQPLTSGNEKILPSKTILRNLLSTDFSSVDRNVSSILADSIETQTEDDGEKL